jgi:hypothetical protein
MEETKSKKITAAVDAYESDFGTIKVWCRTGSCGRVILQTELWAVATIAGRKMVSVALAKTGDSERRQILSEYALVSRNEKASGGVFDNTTS